VAVSLATIQVTSRLRTRSFHSLYVSHGNQSSYRRTTQSVSYCRPVPVFWWTYNCAYHRTT